MLALQIDVTARFFGDDALGGVFAVFGGARPCSGRPFVALVFGLGGGGQFLVRDRHREPLPVEIDIVVGGAKLTDANDVGDHLVDVQCRVDAAELHSGLDGAADTGDLICGHRL